MYWTAKESVFLRIQVRASSQTNVLEHLTRPIAV